MPICQNCSKRFPCKIKIDGVRRNFGKRKYCLTCSPYNKHNTRQLHVPKKKDDRSEIFCPMCKKTLSCDHFYWAKTKNRYFFHCKACCKIKAVARVRANKLQAIKYAGGKCMCCGYNKCQNALEFHHLDPSTKTVGITRLQHGSFSKMKGEIDKCILLCANCHREVESGMKDCSKHPTLDSNQE